MTDPEILAAQEADKVDRKPPSTWLDYLAEEGTYDYLDVEPGVTRCEESGCGRLLPCRHHG